MASSGSFNHDDSQWLFPATRAAEDTGSAATTRLVTTMNDRTDERFYVSSGGSISMQTAASQATASTEQRRRHSNRRSSRGGVEKIRGSKSRPSRSPGMLESVSAYGQASTPAPPGYRSHDSVDMYGSQSEVSVDTQELGPFLPGPYNLSQLNQPLEPFQMFGATGDNRANEWNTVTPASANVPFGDMQESMRAARSATPPSTFYTGPGSFETPDVPGRVHVMVRSWQNLQAEHSWYFQIEMDEFEIKFHHTPSTVKTAGMSSFNENWKNLEEYYLPILRIVIGDDHAFISQIPVFNRLLQTSTIDFLLGPTGFRIMNAETSSLTRKLVSGRSMSNNGQLPAWKEANGQATRNVVARLHDWTLSLRVALKLVLSQDALTDRKMVSYERLAAGEISRSFGKLLQPEATLVYLPIG
jgi:hypothetical protein